MCLVKEVGVNEALMKANKHYTKFTSATPISNVEVNQTAAVTVIS